MKLCCHGGEDTGCCHQCCHADSGNGLICFSAHNFYLLIRNHGSVPEDTPGYLFPASVSYWLQFSAVSLTHPQYNREIS